MSLNSDISKQAHEVGFSRKNFKISHPSLTFNNIPVTQVGSQKHLGISLDSKLNFDEHLCNIQSKVRIKLESIPYNAALAITGATKGSSRETLSRIRPRIPWYETLV